jgi:two-component system alkaline phosphatase synthesis response regulator PhoP
MAPPSILVVDDDQNVAELLGFMFSREGFAPRLVRDGRAAEEYVARNDPAAAVVLDIMLPYRDGFAVAEAIRADARWRHVPIVMLTARVLPEDVDRGRALGVDEYVTKPFRPQALVLRVKTLLTAGHARTG